MFEEKPIHPLTTNQECLLAQPQLGMSEALQIAFTYLGMHRERFEAIHTKELKINCLIYNLVLFEFSLKTLKGDELQHKLKLAELAFNLILDSDLIQEKHTAYSEHSRGLWDLDVRSAITASSDEQPLSASVLPTGKKESGVEPGFVGVLREDLLLRLYHEYENQSARMHEVKSMHFDPNALIARYGSMLDRYLVKLTYQVEGNKAVAQEEDLARTQAIQNAAKYGHLGQTAALQIYKQIKSKNLDELNEEAVSEVLANDVARAMGLPVQDQRLCLQDGHFVLKAKWEAGARLLGPLKGSKTTNGNYIVISTRFSPDGKLRHLSNRHIDNLAESLPLFLVQGDEDCIGSRGQNKLQRTKNLIGIDFGHAYPRKHVAVNNVQHDFTLNDRTFKNYSVFNDASRSEHMKGILLLARMAGYKISETIIKSYGEDFYKRWINTKPQQDEQVFDDYIKKLNLLANDAKTSGEKNLPKYGSLASVVKIRRQRHVDARAKLLEKFKPYISLTASEINTLQNIEKLAASILGYSSIRSEDNTVLLHHVRMRKNPISGWRINHSDPELLVVTAFFSEHNELFQVYNQLKEDFDEHPGFKIEISVNGIKFTVPKANSERFYAAFSESIIKMNYHGTDMAHYNTLLEDESLSENLAQLQEYGITAYIDGNILQFRSDDSEQSTSAIKFIEDGILARGIPTGNMFTGLPVIVAPKQFEVSLGGMDKIPMLKNLLEEFHQHYREHEKGIAEILGHIRNAGKIFSCTFIPLITVRYQHNYSLHVQVKDSTTNETITSKAGTIKEVIAHLKDLETLYREKCIGGYFTELVPLAHELSKANLIYHSPEPSSYTWFLPYYSETINPSEKLREWALNAKHDDIPAYNRLRTLLSQCTADPEAADANVIEPKRERAQKLINLIEALLDQRPGEKDYTGELGPYDLVALSEINEDTIEKAKSKGGQVVF